MASAQRDTDKKNTSGLTGELFGELCVVPIVVVDGDPRSARRIDGGERIRLRRFLDFD